MNTSWGRHDQPEEAVDRILEATENLYVRKGVEQTTMLDVAAEAGCSRATLYLYFPNKSELRTALRNRAAIEIATEAIARVAEVTEPGERVSIAITTVIERVRATPSLSMWFEPASVGLTNELAISSDVLEGIATAFIADFGEQNAPLRARLMIRIILSLLTTPSTDPNDERELIEAVIAPALAAPPTVR